MKKKEDYIANSSLFTMKKKTCSFFFVILALMVFFIAICGGNEAEDAAELAAAKTQFEAAFQGRCDRGSPCEQLCYELHDGMYECDCKMGFELQEDGYSCSELNSTTSPADQDSAFINDEDVLYQKDAIFDAELNFPNYTDYYNSQLMLMATYNVTEFSSTQKQQKSTSESAPILPTTTQSSIRSNYTGTLMVTESVVRPCTLDCGPGGGCIIGGEDGETTTCLCPLGKGGERCEKG